MYKWEGIGTTVVAPTSLKDQCGTNIEIVTGACLGVCFHFGVGDLRQGLMLDENSARRDLLQSICGDGLISRPFSLRLPVSVTYGRHGVMPQRTSSASDSIVRKSVEFLF